MQLPNEKNKMKDTLNVIINDIKRPFLLNPPLLYMIKLYQRINATIMYIRTMIIIAHSGFRLRKIGVWL